MREALLPVLLVLPVGLDVPLLDGELLTSLDSDTLEVDLLNPFNLPPPGGCGASCDMWSIRGGKVERNCDVSRAFSGFTVECSDHGRERDCSGEFYEVALGVVIL